MVSILRLNLVYIFDFQFHKKARFQVHEIWLLLADFKAYFLIIFCV